MSEPWADRDYLRGSQYPQAVAEAVAAAFPVTADGYYAITSHSGCLVCIVD